MARISESSFPTAKLFMANDPERHDGHIYQCKLESILFSCDVFRYEADDQGYPQILSFEIRSKCYLFAMTPNLCSVNHLNKIVEPVQNHNHSRHPLKRRTFMMEFCPGETSPLFLDFLVV